MNLKKLNLVELDAQEVSEIDGGIVPVAIAAWWSGASILAKCGVIGAGVTVVGAGAALGYYNGYYGTKK